MTGKTLIAGWVVQLTNPGVPSVVPEGARWRPAELTPTTFEFFNVAISDAEKAVEAVRKKASVTPEASIRVVRSLSQPEIAAIPLRAGEAKPA